MTLLKRPAFYRDLQKYSDRMAQDNPDAARRFLAAAETTCDALARQPGIGHEESFRKLAGIRSWRVQGFEKYLIFYQMHNDSIEILRLFHGARDLPRFFQSGP